MPPDAHWSDEHHPVSAVSTAPTIPGADGEVLAEADWRAARPWTLRSELEGSPVTRRTAEASAIAELPGSENYAGEQGAHNTLAQEANRQIGPAWRGGSSLRVLNSGAVRE